MSKLGIGFIGCGGIHKAHAPHLVDNDEAFIACAMDVSKEAAKAHCDKYGTKHCTTDRDIVSTVSPRRVGCQRWKR